MELDPYPIVLRYEGRDAERHLLDLAQLGQSIQGASKILAAGGHLVRTGSYVKRQEATTVRVLAGQPQGHCYEITAWITTIMPVVVPILPEISDFARGKAGNAVEAIFNYVIAKLAGKKDHAAMAYELAQKSLAETGQTSRAAIEAMRDVAIAYKPAARQFVAPIGESCEYALVGRPENGAIPIDRNMRAAIEATDPVEIGPEAMYEVLITEIDLQNKTCKFSLPEDTDPTHRHSGAILDPVILNAKNPYSSALNNRIWIRVRGKPELKNGALERVFISNLEGPAR